MIKKDAEKLKQRFIVALLSAGFKSTPEKWHGYRGEGSKGVIDVSVRAEKRYRRRGYDVSVFGAFNDIDRARAAGLDCNPYSGKLNFIFIGSHQVDYIISQYI